MPPVLFFVSASEYCARPLNPRDLALQRDVQRVPRLPSQAGRTPPSKDSGRWRTYLIADAVMPALFTSIPSTTSEAPFVPMLAESRNMDMRPM